MRARIETEHLILRNLTVEDAEAVFLWCGDPKVNRFMIYPLYKDVEEVKIWIESRDPDNPDDYNYGFVRKDTGELIGEGGLVYQPEREIWTMGYNLRADQWRKGYTVEAIEAIIEFIQKSRQITSIAAKVASDNHRSIRVMEKLGMVPVGETIYEKADKSEVFQAKIYRRVFSCYNMNTD